MKIHNRIKTKPYLTTSIAARATKGLLLKKHFSNVERRDYKDELIVDKAEPLVDYILSCHGNQKEYLVDKYKRNWLFSFLERF